MSIKNPLLEGYSSQKKASLLPSTSSSLKSSVLKRTSEFSDGNLLKSSKLLQSSVLSSPSALLKPRALTSFGSSYSSTNKVTYSKQSLSSSLLTTSISLTSQVSDSKSHNVTNITSSSKPKQNLQEETTESKSGEITNFTENSPFLGGEDIVPLPMVERGNVISNYFNTVSKATITLTEEEVLKQDFINLAACSLINVPKLDQKNDSVRIKLISFTDKIIQIDPEFILKMALFTRRVLNIRVTANFLVALAAFKKECRKYIKKYYQEIIVLPSDWIDVAELYTSLGDKNIGFSAIPVCLRKAMTKKFPKFDTYQIGKYNKKPKKSSSKESEDEDDETKLYERHHFTLKQLIRKIHISDPPDIVMPILGKKYPETQEQFYRSRLSGLWDESQAGKRMKVPTPYTWETQLAAKGNNAETWKELILSKKLPYMAMLRNLRNIIQSGVKDNIHKIVQKKLCSPLDVKRSKQFPFRFLSAYAVLDSLESQPGKTISWSSTPDFEQEKILDSYKACLDKAVQLAAINNVKPIKGSLLIFFNCSSLMDEQCSAKGFGITRTIREVAGLMTLMCMFSSEHCDIVYYNYYGTTRGEKIETGGEILKFLSTFVSDSKAADDKLQPNSCASANVLVSMSDCWAEITSKERHYDTMIQIAPVCHDFCAYKNLYREKVNSELLAVDINLKSKTTEIGDENLAHRNDVDLYGFSDQMLQYISQRGSGELLSNVESIDKRFNLLPLPRPMAQNYVSPLAKQITSRVIRIFVSSTFLDLELERRELMNIVMPSINRLVAENNFTIQEVDLRWGVTKEEASSNKVILRCLEEVSRCNYFLCILGERYGTTFDCYPKSPNPEFLWLQNENPGLSMTELEVNYALFHADNTKLPSNNLMFLIKEETCPGKRDKRVSWLIDEIKRNSGDQMFIQHYNDSDITFENCATQALKEVVVKNVLNYSSKDLSDEELHNSYVEQQALLFVGREKLASSLMSAIQREHIVMVTGPVGTGKSALTAKALTMFSADDRMNDFHHVVKLNASSKDLNVLLNRLCFHFSKILNEELDEHFEPISTLWAQVAKCETPCKVLIDGCDELLSSHDMFSWLPDKIPRNITLIFTTSSTGQWNTYLNKKYSSLNTFSVSKLSASEKVQVTKEMLAAYGKKLEEKGFNSQLSLLLSKREANNPLYIDLCINQLRLNAIFENLTQCIQELPQTTEELYVKILKFTVQEVYVVGDKLLAYLYCSKNGISEADMLHFLQLKPLALSNLLYNLKLFINVDQSTGIMSLANQFARKVVQKNCLNDEKIVDVHNELAVEYSFLLGESHYTSDRKDAYQSMLYHYKEAGEWNTISRYLSDLNFVRQMIYLGLLPDLMSLFNIDNSKLKGITKVAYKNAMNKEGVNMLQQFLINNKAILSKEPFLLQQRLLLSNDYFSDRVENDDDLLFNNFVGSFKSLQESQQTYNCNLNEHFTSVITCLDASDVTDIVLVGFHDSKFQAINSSDGTILQTYRGHTGPVTCCSFLTSSRFISAGSDGTLRLWSLLDSVCLAKIEPHIYQVQDIHVNEISKCVISAGIDRRVTVWHNDVIFDTIEFDNPMNCIRFIENGKKFVAGSWTGEVYAYDLVQKVKITVKKSGKVHKNSIRELTTGKKHFASLDITGLVSVWDQMTLDVLQSVRLNNVTTISYDFNDHLMYGLSNGIINITAGFGEMTALPIPDLGAVTAVYSTNDTGIASLFIGFYSGAVYKMYPGSDKTELISIHKGKVNLITSFLVKQSDQEIEHIASCSDDGTIHVHTLDGKVVLNEELAPHIGKILALCPGLTSVLFSGGYDCAITGMKFERGQGDQAKYLTVQKVKLHGHQAPVSTLLTLKEGEKLISGSHDGSVKLWNKHGKCLFTASNAHRDWVTCSSTADSSSQFFVTGSNDNLVVLWKLETSRIFPINKLLGHNSPVTCVSVLGNDKNQVQMIIGGAQDGKLVLWNKDGKFVSATKPGERGVNACTFVADSSSYPIAYVGTVDGEVKSMKPSKLDIIASFTHHTDLVRTVRGMSGNKIVSISADNTIQCWSWQSGSSTSTSSNGIADIKFSVEVIVSGSNTTNLCRIGVMDKCGNISRWTLQDDDVQLTSEIECPKKTKCFALLAPRGNQESTLHVPENPAGIRHCLTSNKFIVEIFTTFQDPKAPFSTMFRVYTHDSQQTYMECSLPYGAIISYADLTTEDILIIGTANSGMMHVWNIKTRKRMPSSSTVVIKDKINPGQYLTSAAFYDGKNIMGLSSGYISVPAKRRVKIVYEKVFNSAVTAMECETDSEGQLVIFAGSKDGVLKVLTAELKVIGMYHTNGPVTTLRVLRNSTKRWVANRVYVVVGDKCGCVHFLKWFPPRRQISSVETVETVETVEDVEMVEEDW
ncbi:hypothetical protein ACHWQZ_G011221 [Mnemiopsis leidyi]